MSSSKKTASLSEPAQALLEQYKHYRDDGIVEIKEPVSSEQESQSESKPDTHHKPTEITQKIIEKNKLPEKKQRKIVSDIAGVLDKEWNELETKESYFVGEYEHKVNNIALMQKYETMKDPSPFNEDNDMDLQTKWERYLWNESMQKQQEYLDKTKPTKKITTPKRKKKKKKVNFSPQLITKEASSERVIDAQVPCKTKTVKEPVKLFKSNKKHQAYGNLVGFFNKKQKKKEKKKKVSSTADTDSNPYLDKKLMKEVADFTPNNNQLFEQKFDHKNNIKPTIIGSNEFNSVIIPSDEFNSKLSKTKENDSTSQKSKSMQHGKGDLVQTAFNGRVFERKPPDMVYIDDNYDGNETQPVSESNKVKPQSLPKITRPKTSLFRKRIERNDAFYESEDVQTTTTKFPKVISLKKEDGHNLQQKAPTCDKKKVRFADSLVSKQLVIKDDDEYQQKEDICLLFLDVDGVLNCTYSPSLSRAHILRLKKILNRTTNCKICISSSWRVYTRTRLQLLDGMRHIGNIDVKSVVIGDTPRIRKDPMTCRPEEIQTYLRNNEYLNDNYNVLRWCAIDDIPLDSVNFQYGDFMKGHFVKTDPCKGLTDRDVEKVLSILNGVKLVDELDAIHEEKEQNDNMQLQVIEKKEKKKIKILFLDVDGVLNYKGFDDKGVSGTLSMKHLQRLKQIVEKTKCYIVLSASWRRIPSAKQQLLNQLSSRCGMNVKEKVIGDTPVLGSQMKKSLEICQYLDNIKNTNAYDVLTWIAIDDMPLDKIGTKRTKEMLNGHFVKTNVETGLSDNNVLSAISLLGVE